MSLRLFSTWLSSANETKACACTKSRLRLFIAMLFLSLWRQCTMYRGLSVKLGLGHWQTVQTQIRRHRTWRLIRICIVCLNYRKLRVKWNDFKFPFRTIFPAHRDNRPTSVVSALIIICFYCGFSYSLRRPYVDRTQFVIWAAPELKAKFRSSITSFKFPA